MRPLKIVLLLMALPTALGCVASARSGHTVSAGPPGIEHSKPMETVVQVLCVANATTESGGQDHDIVTAGMQLVRLCDSLEKVPGVAAESIPRDPQSSLLSRPQLEKTLANLRPDRGRVLIYLGHGIFDEVRGPRTLSVPLAKPGGGAELWTFREIAQALIRGRPASGPPSGWAAIVMNACDSGYADIAQLSTPPSAVPFTLIGAGYGNVALREPKGRSARLTGDGRAVFMDALEGALMGGADRPPIGNTDGVISDRELFEYVNLYIKSRRLAWLVGGRPSTAGNAAKETAFWMRAPLAVWKSEADQELPIAQTRAVSQFVPLAARNRTLWVLDACGVPEITRALGGEASSLGFQVNVAARIETAQSEDSWLLNILPSSLNAPNARCYVELRRARDRRIVWADTLDRPLAPAVSSIVVAKEARLIARRLPRRLQLFDWGAATPGSAPWVGVSVEGSFPTKPVRLVSYESYFERRASGAPLDLSSRFVAPCPGAQGQCFLLPRPQTLEHQPLSEWLLLE